METNFINSRNSKPHRFRLDLVDKRNLKPKKNMALVNLRIYYTGKHIKSEQNNNKIKTFAPTWNDTFDLPDGSYSIVDIQDYFQLIIRRHENLAKGSPVQIYPNQIKNIIVFQIKSGYNLELLSPETMRLLESTKKDVNKDKDDENVPKLESVEVVLLHCNLVKNDYRDISKVLFIFVPNKQFGQSINISQHSLTIKNTVNTELSSVEVQFTDKVRKAFEIEDNYNLTLIIGQTL